MINHSYLAKSSDLLARHVSVHSEVFGFSVRKLLPIPFLFKKIDYAYLWSESDEIYHELRRLISDIQESPLTLKRDEILIEYLSALSESSRHLSVLLKRLSQKSSGISNYQRSEYNSDLETYERSQKRYSKLGIKLNEHLA